MVDRDERILADCTDFQAARHFLARASHLSKFEDNQRNLNLRFLSFELDRDFLFLARLNDPLKLSVMGSNRLTI
jgi:hypothetical protein